MNIDDLTLGEAKKLVRILSAGDSVGIANPEYKSDSHWQIGENYLIRTVTHINIGKLIAVTDKELILQDASWIADTGRFEQAVKDGTLNEVEPFPNHAIVIVGRGALIDAVIWSHPLPREQK